MPKRSKKSNQGCCLVSLILWPFKLLEDLVNSLSGQTTVRTSSGKPQTVQRNVQLQVQPRSDRFVEVIPARSKGFSQPTVSVLISYESSGTVFLKEAQKLRGKEGSVSPHVPFMHYWPTYRDMNSSQQRWYFYWRSQIRRGNYLPTDLSYIFVHVYEILNLVEFADPLQATNRLKVLWESYRGTYPQLDRYLPEWGGDLLAVKAGREYALSWWEHLLELEGIAFPDEVINAIVEKVIRTGGTDSLSFSIWSLLSSYRPKNKFYQMHNINHQIDHAYEKAIKVANDYYLRTSQKSLIDKFVSERVYPYNKYVFSSALIGFSYPRTIQLGSGRNYASSARLSNNITSIMKYAENILRKQLKFSAKLSGVELPVKLAKELDIAFIPPVPKPEPIHLTIDPSRVATLHKESEEVSALLATDPENVERALLTDLVEVRKLWRGFNHLERQLVTGIFKGDLRTLSHVEKILVHQEITVSDIVEKVNAKSLPVLGDRLIYLSNSSVILAEDFLDELDVVIQELPPEKFPPEADNNLASDPWLSFFDRLEPAEIEILKLLTQERSLSEANVDTVTKAYSQMGNAVMDSLNEKAFDCLAHLPIYLEGNEWLIEEDDLPILQKHLGNEVN